MGERQRLGRQDALWLEMDKPGNLMVVDSLFWAATPIDWERFRDNVQVRLWDRYPVFRSVAVHDDDGSWWWEEQPGADLSDRFEQMVLPEPGGDAELQALIASERTAPLDRSQPLWRIVLVDGYRGGSAVLLRGHHAIADGIRMVQVALTVLDVGPDGDTVPAYAAHKHVRTTVPPALVPQADAVRRPLASRVRSAATGVASTSVQLTRSTVTNPVGAASSAVTLSGSLVGAAGSRARSAAAFGIRAPRALPSLLSAVPGDVDTARKLLLGTRNDYTRWTGTVSLHKAIAWSSPLPLADVKAVAHAHGATVNDVLVTCVAGSLRSYLREHRSVGNSVCWDVPVNLKPFDPDLPVVLGNGFALVQLELPTNIDDPLRTLEVVQGRMSRIKSGHEAVVDFGVQAAVSRMSKRLYRATVDLIANRAVGVLTNVPGPDLPLYAGGQRIEGMIGWAPLTADQVMSVTIFSYDGKVFVGIAADAGLVPDHEQVVDGFTESFHRLVARTR